jgi:integrase
VRSGQEFAPSSSLRLFSACVVPRSFGSAKDAVDRERANIKLLETKSNRPRVLPISAALDKVLADAIASSPSASEFVFTQPMGRNRGKPYTPAAVTLAFRRAVVEAGIENLRLHDIRHDFATKLRRAGTGIDVIKELLGHSNISVTMRYAHVEPAPLRAAVADLVAPVAPLYPPPAPMAHGRR